MRRFAASELRRFARPTPPSLSLLAHCSVKLARDESLRGTALALLHAWSLREARPAFSASAGGSPKRNV